MTPELLRSFFGWSALINIGVLTAWLLVFWLAHDAIYRLHSRLVRVSVETFDAIHYAAMAGYKIAIWMFNLVPYLVLALLD